MTNVDTLMAYEDGTLSERDSIAMFADLIETGMAWRLQGSYGRAAAALIEQGYVSPEGEVLVEVAG